MTPLLDISLHESTHDPVVAPSADRPTEIDLAVLGDHIAEQGFARCGPDVWSLAGAAAAIVPAAAAVLVDEHAPTVLRQRAFSVAAAAVSRAGCRGRASGSDSPRRP